MQSTFRLLEERHDFHPEHAASGEGVWLWITGPHGKLHQRLQNFDWPHPNLILQLDELTDSGPLSAHTLERIADAINHRDLTGIIICGETDAIAESTDDDHCSAAGAVVAVSPLLQRTRERMRRQRRVQLEVINRYEQIRNDPPIAAALARKLLRLQGMFYVAEHDSFLLYDPSLNRFHSPSVVNEVR
ncbi:MAG: hypothetical protein R3B90_10615 [Planctomycetaceae bacterium]